jgi:glycosyltransferase involved in cell wall biosynthesis
VQDEGRTPTVSVVVCAYTMARWDLVGRALRSVRSQTRPALEILLVVDHCPELLARAPELCEGVRVLPNAGAVGLSGARNTGVAAARGKVVAFLDDDAAAAPDWLERLVRPYDDPRVVGVGGQVTAEWEGGRPAWFPQEFNWVVGCSYVGQPTVASVVRNPIGANMSFRRDPVVAVGGFSAEVGRVGTRPAGCEETELSIRVVRRDPTSSIVLEPRAVVRHHVPEDRSRWAYFWRRCWAEGVSKASVSRLTDPRSALSSERSYTLRTLPRGAARGIGDAVRHRGSGGAARALAIGAGLAITAAGYATGRAGRAAAPHTHPEGELA